MLSMAPFLTPNQKTFSIFQNLQELGLLPLRKPDCSLVYMQTVQTLFSLYSTQVSLVLVQATDLTLVLDSCYLQK